MQLSDWSDWSLIVKRNSPSVTSMNHHNSLVGYLAIQILPVLQIFKLQHTVQALILHLDNNKGCSFILKGLMSLRSEDGTQYNLLALFSSSKLMMSYLLDYIDWHPLWESRFCISKCWTLTFAAMSTLTPGPMSRVTGIWSAWTRWDYAPKKGFNKIRLANLLLIKIPTLHLPFEKWAGASRWVPLGKKIWTLPPSKVGNISKFATK